MNIGLDDLKKIANSNGIEITIRIPPEAIFGAEKRQSVQPPEPSPEVDGLIRRIELTREDNKVLPDRWLSVSQAADYFGRIQEEGDPERAIRRKIQQRLLYALKDGKRWLVSSASCVLSTHDVTDPRPTFRNTKIFCQR